MHVFCKSTNGNAESSCCVCGQGFVVFWERQSRSERISAMREIQKTLRNHHRNQSGPQAHPANAFMVPQIDRHVTFSSASILGNAPSWAL
jgi:hypothetical protein